MACQNHTFRSCEVLLLFWLPEYLHEVFVAKSQLAQLDSGHLTHKEPRDLFGFERNLSVFNCL